MIKIVEIIKINNRKKIIIIQDSQDLKHNSDCTCNVTFDIHIIARSHRNDVRQIYKYINTFISMYINIYISHTLELQHNGRNESRKQF